MLRTHYRYDVSTSIGFTHDLNSCVWSISEGNALHALRQLYAREAGLKNWQYKSGSKASIGTITRYFALHGFTVTLSTTELSY
jgi:hypothetical protein